MKPPCLPKSSAQPRWEESEETGMGMNAGAWSRPPGDSFFLKHSLRILDMAKKKKNSHHPSLRLSALEHGLSLPLSLSLHLHPGL